MESTIKCECGSDLCEHGVCRDVQCAGGECLECAPREMADERKKAHRRVDNQGYFGQGAYVPQWGHHDHRSGKDRRQSQ